MLFSIFSVSLLYLPNVLFSQEVIKVQNTGINTGRECLMWMWKGCFKYEEILLNKKDSPRVTVTSIAQDAVLLAGYMVWTILTIVIIYCGIRYILAARNGEDVKTYRKWLVSAAIWAVLVRWAYAIVRLIQYIAKW